MNEKIIQDLRILLADDDDDVRQALSEFLRAEGYRILEADSGPAALEILHRQPTSVSFSIMDVDMPGMTGIEVLRIVRQQLGAFPCIFISGDDSRRRQAEAMEVGAFSLIRKPVALDLLRFSMQRLLERHYGKSP